MAFESRRADTVRVGDVIHTRAGARTVVGVRSQVGLIGMVVVTVAGGEVEAFLPSELVHTERAPQRATR